MESSLEERSIKIRMRIVGVAAWLLLVLLGGCSESPDAYTFVSTRPTSLLQGFTSYSTPDQVKALMPPGVIAATVEDSRLKPSDRRPRFDVLVVEFAGYLDQGHPGTLRMKFFNERLMSTWFYADDHEGYLETLGRNGLPLREESSKTIGFTHIWVHRDFFERPYVGREDVRLDAEMIAWIYRYS